MGYRKTGRPKLISCDFTPAELALFADLLDSRSWVTMMPFQRPHWSCGCHKAVSHVYHIAQLDLMLRRGVLAKPSSDVIPTMYGTSSSRIRTGGRGLQAQDGDGSDLDI